jgi:hypothetical protein
MALADMVKGSTNHVHFDGDIGLVHRVRPGFTIDSGEDVRVAN